MGGWETHAYVNRTSSDPVYAVQPNLLTQPIALPVLQLDGPIPQGAALAPDTHTIRSQRVVSRAPHARTRMRPRPPAAPPCGVRAPMAALGSPVAARRTSLDIRVPPGNTGRSHTHTHHN